MHDEGALDRHPREGLRNELGDVEAERADEVKRRSAGFVSGPRMLKIVRTPNAARIGATAFIAG